MARAAEIHYEGVAYSVPGGEVVYREEHWIRDEGETRRRLVLYRCPDGAPFARKTVAGKIGSAAPDFEMLDGRDGYRDGVRQREGKREVFFQEKAGASERSAPLPSLPNAVIDAGFDAYVRGRWADLENAGTLRIPFLIPERLGYVELKLAGSGSSIENGESVRKLRMNLDAWYSFAAPTLVLTYAEKDQRLRRFEGISNVRDAAGRNQKVRIEFPEAQTPARMDANSAGALSLVRRCASAMYTRIDPG